MSFSRAPWASPSLTLHSADPVFNKTGISISYFQNCLSVYETFITLYITYTCRIDDLHMRGLNFMKPGPCHELMKVDYFILSQKSLEKTLVAWRTRTQYHTFGNVIRQVKRQFYSQTSVDSKHLCKMQSHTLMFLHLTWEEFIQALMSHQAHFKLKDLFQITYNLIRYGSLPETPHLRHHHAMDCITDYVVIVLSIIVCVNHCLVRMLFRW
jgi:hypothetical protein